MKKLFTICAVGISFMAFSQKETSVELSAGYAQKGDFNFGFSSKNIHKNLGGYLHVRGISGAGDFKYGTDYSSISSASIIRTIHEPTEYFGVVAGPIYSIENSGLSIGLGLGYTMELTPTTYQYKYDFQYIDDEYSSETIVDRESKLNAEIMLDYKINPAKRNGIGLQAGFNIIHKGFAMLYYSF